MMFSATAHAGDMTEAGLRAQLQVLNRELVRLAFFPPIRPNLRTCSTPVPAYWWN
jgi:hypothetical protein